ncbi:MAG TPA: hypothetical protein VGH39_00190, partial [Xanthobacteraceae bacterium]
PLATEMRAGAAVVLTLKWDQRFESAFLQQRVTSEPWAARLTTLVVVDASLTGFIDRDGAARAGT